MVRTKKIDRPKEIKVYLPESLYALVRLELYSELEGGVPYGAQNEFFINVVREHLRARGHQV